MNSFVQLTRPAAGRLVLAEATLPECPASKSDALEFYTRSHFYKILFASYWLVDGVWRWPTGPPPTPPRWWNKAMFVGAGAEWRAWGGGVRGWSAPQSLYCLPATVADWPSSSYVYLLLHLNEGCLDRSAEGNGPNLQVCVHTFSSGKCFYFTLLWVRKHPTVEIRVFRLVFPRKYRIQTLEGHLIPSVSQQNTTEDQSVWKCFHHEDCQVK